MKLSTAQKEAICFARIEGTPVGPGCDTGIHSGCRKTTKATCESLVRRGLLRLSSRQHWEGWYELTAAGWALTAEQLERKGSYSWFAEHLAKQDVANAHKRAVAVAFEAEHVCPRCGGTGLIFRDEFGGSSVMGNAARAIANQSH